MVDTLRLLLICSVVFIGNGCSSVASNNSINPDSSTRNEKPHPHIEPHEQDVSEQTIVLPEVETCPGGFFATNSEQLKEYDRRPLQRGEETLSAGEKLLYRPLATIQPGEVAALGGIKELWALEFSYSRLPTGDVPSMAALAQIPGIRAIHLSNCSDSADFLNQKALWDKIDRVHLRGVAVNSASLNALERFSYLTTLSLHDFTWEAEFASHLVALSSIENVKLDNCDGLRLGWLAERETLREVVLVGVGLLSEGELHNFAKTGIRKITVEQVGISSLAWINGCERLEAVRLGWCEKLPGPQLHHLKNLQGLKGLWIASCSQVTLRDLHVVSELPRLQSLRLTGLRFAEDANSKYLFRCIANTADLEVLDLSYSTALSVQLLGLLIESPNRIRHLRFVGTAVGDKEMRVVAKLETLELLEVGNSQMAGDGPVSRKCEEEFRASFPKITLVVER